MTAGTAWAPGLEAAFTAYEDALARDDTAVLDALFEPGPGTLRGDDAGLLRGHDVISAFRSARGGIAPRTIESVELRTLTEDTVLVVGVSAFDGGGRGLQTQLWRRTEGVWRIAVAHVTGRPRAFDSAVWRVVGDPLVRGRDTGTDTGTATDTDRPLAGVRVAVKDLFDVAGQVVGAGNPERERSAPVATAHAPAVQVLLDAGADVTGIARTDEFAYSLAGRNAHSGTTPNGADPTRIGGGSTSGPASAVALGQADLGLGTDTAGSLRVPASYQGLWGIRTTHGAVSRQGLLPLAQSFDTVGWLARTPDVLAAAVGVALPDADGALDDGTVDDGTLLVADALLDAAEPATASAFDAWLRATERAVRRISLPDLDDLAETLRVVQAAEAWRNHGTWVTEHPGALGTDVAERFALAAAVTADDEAAARARLPELRDRIRDAIGGGVLCLPSVPGPAPSRSATGPDVLATRRATLRMTAVAGVGGLPAVSAPLLRVEGAPVGVCFVGAAGTDRALVALASTTPSIHSHR